MVSFDLCVCISCIKVCVCVFFFLTTACLCVVSDCGFFVSATDKVYQCFTLFVASVLVPQARCTNVSLYLWLATGKVYQHFTLFVASVFVPQARCTNVSLCSSHATFEMVLWEASVCDGCPFWVYFSWTYSWLQYFHCIKFTMNDTKYAIWATCRLCAMIANLP